MPTDMALVERFERAVLRRVKPNQQGHDLAQTEVTGTPTLTTPGREWIAYLVAWRSGYRLWKYNVRRDTVSKNTPLNVSIYMEKLDN